MTTLLSTHFNTVRHKCWKLIDRKYPETRTKYDLSLDLVRRSVEQMTSKRNIRILDAGCGRKSGIRFHSNSNVTLFGIDVVLDGVKKNSDIDAGLVTNLENIALDYNSVDIIFSNMVFEHLRKPDAFFREVSRILKPGGFLIFSTPCIYNIAVVLNRFLPDPVSRKLGYCLTGVAEEDIFPTVYKANSPRRLRRLFENTSFRQTDLIMYQPPPYAFVFSTAVCRLLIAYYRIITSFSFLKNLRGVIIARYQKGPEITLRANAN
jgi:2-polyprenyl-3-methyl-5-hydroxy-6-metoxy-1,4-benzoquinol methylase